MYKPRHKATRPRSYGNFESGAELFGYLALWTVFMVALAAGALLL